MSGTTVRANCLDASALVKLQVPEPGSAIGRAYRVREPTKYATPFCFYEVLNVPKVKWQYRNRLSRDGYLQPCFALAAWYSASSKRVNDPDFTLPAAFVQAKRLVERTSFDVSDAFQILSVKLGYFSCLGEESKTVLVTGDKDLAAAARGEGLRDWYFIDEPAP